MQENIEKIIKGESEMSKAGVSFEFIKNNLLLDDEFKEEYEKLHPRYEIISQIVELRKEKTHIVK